MMKESAGFALRMMVSGWRKSNYLVFLKGFIVWIKVGRGKKAELDLVWPLLNTLFNFMEEQ
jgi:hypothetical protein